MLLKQAYAARIRGHDGSDRNDADGDDGERDQHLDDGETGVGPLSW
jgi:hypothetical protein